MKNDRLFQLLYLLLERQSSTAPALAALLEVSVRTVYRDVEALCMAGVPICTTAGKGGGISLMPGYTVDRTLLSPTEQSELLFALQSLRAAGQEVEPLLRKLGSLFRQPQDNWIEVDFSRWGLRQADNKKFQLLKEGILQRRLLRLHYYNASGQGGERSVKPFRLIFKSKNWYLFAYCLKAEDIRLFKLSRMEELTLLEEHFTEDFSAASAIDEEGPPPFSPTHFRLRFSPAVAFRLYDEFAPQSIQPQGDGFYLVETAFPPDDWVRGYLLSFGTGVEILEPLSWRSHIADLARSICLHHEGDCGQLSATSVRFCAQ